MSRSKLSEGQVLVEAAVFLGCVFAIGMEAAWIYQDIWQRIRCQVDVFESTHAQLVGNRWSGWRFQSVQISEDTYAIRGKLRCGKHTEEISFKKIPRI